MNISTDRYRIYQKFDENTQDYKFIIFERENNLWYKVVLNEKFMYDDITELFKYAKNAKGYDISFNYDPMGTFVCSFNKLSDIENVINEIPEYFV